MALDFPLTKTIQLLRRTTITDGFGDQIEIDGEPEDLTVLGWYLTGGTEAGPDGHLYRVDWDATVIAPTGAINTGDRIQLPGYGVFHVHGQPNQWDDGPWFTPGLAQVNLKKAGDR